jgi:hypothetical protein
MEYVCDAPNDQTWFRLVTEAEAVAESEEMRHAVEKHYKRERPLSNVYIEQDIGKEAHIQRAMPLFLTLRDQEGAGLATAMLPPGGKSGGACIIVGPGNADPYIDNSEAIEALADHYGLSLDRAHCYPYRR